jgi:anthraniloyl-CoA monooxygenase
LKTRRWSHENVVLLGDAAHTAHFSIGSGTKLALEDAIALANAFEEDQRVPTALRAYEQGRRPRVEATQRAAAESQRYFETVSRYRNVEPEQFTFHLLTRSGRITYDNLKQRDPYFVAGVERWFMAAHADNGAPLIAPQPMFAPLQLRELQLPNRAVLLTTPTASSHGDIEQLGLGGAGLILAGPIAVEAAGRITPDDAGLYDDDAVLAWTTTVAAIHESADTKLGVSLSHAGRRGATRPRSGGTDRPLRDGGWPLLSASAIPYTPRSQTPQAMTRSDMDRVRDAYVSAAQRADAAGFDLIQLDMSRGYLLASFLSPLTNQRDDEFGGDREQRLRYPLDVLDAVRDAWPAEKPLAVAISASDRARGGNRLSDAVEIAPELKAHGCDLITVHAGQTIPNDRASFDFATAAHYTDVIRTEAGIPTLATGYATTSNHLNTLLAGGRADLSVIWVRE